MAVERSLGGRAPEHAIAAHRRDHGIPGPHRHREIEGADHAHDAQRMPLLVHAMAGPLAVHGEAVELAREADGEIGDVDHLLHFAQALGQDLAHFERDQRAQILLCARAVRCRFRARSRRAGERASCAIPGRPRRRAPSRFRNPPRPAMRTRASASPVAGLRESSSPPDGFGDPIAIAGAGIHGLDVQFFENIGNNQVRSGHALILALGGVRLSLEPDYRRKDRCGTTIPVPCL